MIKAPQWYQDFKKMLDNSEHIVGMNARNLELIYPNNRRPDYPLADNKLITKQWLIKHDFPTTQLMAVIEHHHQIDEVMDQLNPQSGLVIKPAQGSGGQGIQLAFPGQETWQSSGGRELSLEELKLHTQYILTGHYSKESEQESAIIEALVYPDSRILPELKSLCDLRIITHQGKVVAAMLRVPTQLSNGKANLHQGGIGIGINLKTGLTTQATCLGQSLDHHPNSGEALISIEIPNWEEIMNQSRRLAELCPLKYLGIDWALSNEGPMILEMNTRPGLEIQNANMQGLRDSLKEAV